MGTMKLVDYVQKEIGGALRQHIPLEIYFLPPTGDVTEKVGNKIQCKV